MGIVDRFVSECEPSVCSMTRVMLPAYQSVSDVSTIDCETARYTNAQTFQLYGWTLHIA